MKKATPRRSRCLHCNRMIVEKQVIKAADAKQYINEFGSYDEELVWIDRMENRALCDTMNHGTGHITEKEWKVASGN